MSNLICCIPTKNRPSTKTHLLFQGSGIPVLHFLEPQDFDKYTAVEKINILKNNQGIAYVRNFILNWARENGYDWIIMCDDDISGFGLYDNGNLKRDGSIWNEIFEKASKLPFEVIGINYAHLAWCSDKIYSINSALVEVCVLINLKKVNWSYRNEFCLKEDRDFTLQTVKNGNGVLKFNRYYFQCPTIGSNKGGLFDEYKSKKDEGSAVSLAKEWHPFVQVVKKSNRLDVKCNLKNLAKHFSKKTA